jgi:pimeloyl-ACP methyl ester carboxylesterase
VGAAPNRAADLDTFYAQKLTWGPCRSFAPSTDDTEMFSRPDFDCAYLTVPLDYSQPKGQIARIAVLRQKAADRVHRIGSLVVNPGGEGSSGNQAVAEAADWPGRRLVLQRFDIVGFDPRGIGASTPRLDCLTPEQRDAFRPHIETDDTPVGLDDVVAQAKSYAATCLRASGRALLANVGARDVARDMDILRAALGDKKLTYLGFSYGTRIASSYAEQFPHNVRAMILDGALDPNEDPAEGDMRTAAAFQAAFVTFATDCATRPGCPLGTDPKAATAVFTTLVKPLIDNPIPLRDGRQLSYNDAIIGTIYALYLQARWPQLELALQALPSGRGGRMMFLADGAEGRQRDGSYDTWPNATVPITCSDNDPITDRDRLLRLNTTIDQMTPFRDDGAIPIPGRDICPFWPVPNTSQKHQLNIPALAQPWLHPWWWRSPVTRPPLIRPG